jgi:hypothetical protein
VLTSTAVLAIPVISVALDKRERSAQKRPKKRLDEVVKSDKINWKIAFFK